jgi:hypothetical protein
LTAFGITGHQDISKGTRLILEPLVDETLRVVEDLIGISSLAIGADQLFANSVLRCGGRLQAVIPAIDYAERFPAGARRSYEALLGSAWQTIELPFERADESAYWAAGQEIVHRSDALIAIWDGEPAAGLGGTADVVQYARKREVPVKVLWPAGAARTGLVSGGGGH